MITVSVLMSVHNGMPYLPATVDSVLSQTHRDFEFVIVDDASTDASAKYLRSVSDPRVRVITLPRNIGLTAALNEGLRQCQGTFVARQDADDLSHPQRLAAQVAFLQAHPECVAVGAQVQLIDEQGHSQGRKHFPLHHPGIMLAHLFDNALAHAAVTFRRETVLALGGYDEAWTASQDYELWSRLSARHELANVSESLATLRILSSSITRQHKRPELIRRVQAAHFMRLTGRAATEDELDLIALFRSRVPPARLPAFRALLQEVVAGLVAKQPNLSHNPDFRRTLSMLHERVGYNLLTVSRWAAWRELWCALRLRPSAIWSFPWLRIGALTVLGDSARRIYERATK